ncbi:ATP synthase F0 subunit B [Alloprevotella sp. OH1205_COT-284]|nr:F0F1 ATP synthase subunit B [Alloprevotella sp. OH1205_COT-284]RRD80420.1 ATP synthase F0 subunit B [Alloprevotella sp. OH1205_COT-284]
MESLNLPSILTPDFGLLFWMFIAFAVVFFILAKFGFPVITDMVEARKKFIDESLKNARTANEKLAEIQTESEQMLREAREKQAEILKEAAATRDAIIKEAKNKAEIEGSKILEEAKAQIKIEKTNALREIRSQVADLSIKIAEKVIRKELEKEKEQESFILGVLNDIEKETNS